MSDKFQPTGNEFVSLPCIREEDGALLSATFLHMGFRGLIDLGGTEQEPFLKPFLRQEGREIPLKMTDWKREEYWIPTFTCAGAGLEMRGTILSPVGHRGFVYRMEYHNPTDTEIRVTAGMCGCWEKCIHAINEDKPIEGTRHAYASHWDESGVFDLRIGVSAFAFAISFTGTVEKEIAQQEDEIRYRFSRELNIAPGKTETVDCYFGAGIEEVSALTSGICMRRHGYDRLYAVTAEWLHKRARKLTDPALERTMNLNLFFNFFFAAGKTIDTEEFVLVTSRSPRYYVSAAYWDRDSLLWSFPSILLADREYAREMLLYVFTRQRKNFGTHSRYIDGTTLEPEFELDELCAPVIALGRYIEVTGEREFLTKECVAEGVKLVLRRLEEHRHPAVDLYDTFCQPSDDVALDPYLTYDNVLVWKVYTTLASLYRGIWDAAEIVRMDACAARVRAAILEHCIKEKDGKRVFAWSVDLSGGWHLYDEPPGSLQMLPHYGFCSLDDEVFVNTVASIRNPEYRLSFADCEIPEIGCDHAPHPWILSLSNALLSGQIAHGKLVLSRVSMDNGIACESVDEHTGESATGDAFATCAGFLSFAMDQAFGEHK